MYNQLIRFVLLIILLCSIIYTNIYAQTNNRIILFVWDGLRADVISKEHTPNLYKLAKLGTNFTDHHSSYPTVTMNNANSLATGNYSGQTGFYGNRIWRSDMQAQSNEKADFKQPVYVQNHFVLAALN